LDKLTVQGRLAYVIASRLTIQELTDVVDGLIRRPRGGGHVANSAAAALISLAKAAADGAGDEETEGVAWADMSPAQRAAARAVLDREILRLAELPETEGEPDESTPSSDPP
jgi:hypothetical protein